MNGFTIANPDPDRLGAVAAKHGLIAIKKGFRLNRAYTPKNCRAMAERLTGRKFKARDYDGMIAALEEYLNHNCVAISCEKGFTGQDYSETDALCPDCRSHENTMADVGPMGAPS
jgi:hypothetical protein